jgi:hypothetical protein
VASARSTPHVRVLEGKTGVHAVHLDAANYPVPPTDLPTSSGCPRLMLVGSFEFPYVVGLVPSALVSSP